MAVVLIHVLRAPGAILRSIRDHLLSTSDVPSIVQKAEDMKIQKKGCKMLVIF